MKQPINEIERMQKLAGISTESRYNGFMLEWIIPEKESNTLISKNLGELFQYIIDKDIKEYTIKGMFNNKWELLVSTANPLYKTK